MKTIILKAYQTAAVWLFLNSKYDWCFEFPTGAGKTVMIVAMVGLLLRRKIKVVIASPQEHIEQAFVVRDYDNISVDESTLLAVPPDMIRAARKGPAGSVKEVLAYLNNAHPGYALACTHATLTHTNMRPVSGLPDCSGVVFAIDEAQHAPAQALGQFITAARAANSRSLFTTATAFRDNMDPVILPGMKMERRSLAEHIADVSAKCSPKRIDTRVVSVFAGQITEAQFEGEDLPNEIVQDRLVSEMVKTWLADDRPKIVVKVPIVKGGTQGLVTKLISAFTEVNARILDVTGQEPEDKKRFLDVLPEERKVKKFEDSQYDVIVGVQRVNEGMDWPLCSTVYVLGLPRSPQLVMQLLGRAMRYKGEIANYPKEHADRAAIVFFVPTGDAETQSNMGDYFSRYVLVVLAYMVNSTTGGEWALAKDIGRGMTVKLGTDDETISVVKSALGYVDHKFRIDAVTAIAAARERLVLSGSLAPDVDVLQAVYEDRPDLNRAMLRQVMVEMICAENNETAARVKRRLLSEINDAVAKDASVYDAIQSAFNAVLLDLDSHAIVESTVLADMTDKVIKLTGSGMLKLAKKLAAKRPLTPDWLGMVYNEYRRRKCIEKGNDPTNDVQLRAIQGPTGTTPGGPDGYPDETWSEIDAAIRQGKRDWPLKAYKSLADFGNNYVRRGTVEQRLAEFRRELKLEPAEIAVVEALLMQRVQAGGTVVPFGELPVTTLKNGWPENCWHVVRQWWLSLKTSSEAPILLDLYAAIVLRNLYHWLRRKNMDPPVFVTPEELTDVFAKYNSCEVHYQVGGAASWTFSGATVTPNLQLHDGGLARLAVRDEPCWYLTRQDKIPVKRRDNGLSAYNDADIAARLYLNPITGRPVDLASAKSKLEKVPLVYLPLAWITCLIVPDGQVNVPTDWVKAIRKMPAKTYTKSGGVVVS